MYVFLHFTKLHSHSVPQSLPPGSYEAPFHARTAQYAHCAQESPLIGHGREGGAEIFKKN